MVVTAPPVTAPSSPASDTSFHAPATSPGLRTGDWIRLVGWKARLAGRRVLDAAGGNWWIEREGKVRATECLRPYEEAANPIASWLARPEGGRFWFPMDSTALSSCPPERSRELAGRAEEEADCNTLEWADAAVARRFELLGAATRPGAEPRWRLDLYTGAEWPLERSSTLRIMRGDGSDIRTVWELSRGYHFPALARAFGHTGEVKYREAFVDDVESWLDQNPLGRGPHWVSPMDVAIRAANWTIGVAQFAGADGIELAFWRWMLSNLYASGLYLERHLEWHPVYRGNHFVANAVGLVYLGVLFRGTRGGDRWLRKGRKILEAEIRYQVHPDGVSFESSLAYHRLVTELFAYGGELIRLNCEGGITPEYEERLRRMYRFIDSYLPESGEAPMIGDADDGRLHAIDATALHEPRKHRLGLPNGYWPTDSPGPRAFPHGGFYVMRSASDHAVIRCGPVGIRGAGSHDHNDQLSYELVLGGRRVIADSGTYAYTRDLQARHAFRSTAAHSVVQLGDEEQNPIDERRPWRVLADRTRSECVTWSTDVDGQLFVGRHLGYAHRPSGAVCQRKIAFDCRTGEWQITDEITGRGVEEVTWRLHFAAGELTKLLVHEVEGGLDHLFRFSGAPDIHIRVQLPPGMELREAVSEASDRYGSRYPRPTLIASGRLQLPTMIVATFQSGSPR